MKISAQARTIPFEYILIVFDSPIEMIEQGLEFLKVGLMNDENDMVVTDAMPIDAIREDCEGMERCCFSQNEIRRQDFTSHISRMEYTRWQMTFNTQSKTSLIRCSG